MYSGKFKSSNGVNDVYYYVYGENITNPYAVVQLSHGMIDHIGRYNEFIKFLNKNNIVVCGCDDLGHGETGKNSTYGFFADKNGKDYVLEDLYKMTKIIKHNYKGLPFYMIGHSMGSFFARAYAYDFPNELNGLILLGTSGSVSGIGFGMLLIDILMLIKGKRSYIRALEKFTDKSYCKKIDNVTKSRDWVTTDDTKLDEYYKDEKCSFTFSLSAYHDLLSILNFVSSKKWYKNLDVNVPILLASGTDDPVGQYGKGVLEVYKKLKKHGQKNVDLKLYANAKHELHNEVPDIRQEFFDDVLKWIKENNKN